MAGNIGSNSTAQKVQYLGSYGRDYYAPIGTGDVLLSASDILADALSDGTVVRLSDGTYRAVASTDYIARVSIALKPLGGHTGIPGTVTTTADATHERGGGIYDIDPGGESALGQIRSPEGYLIEVNTGQVTVSEGSCVVIGVDFASVPAPLGAPVVPPTLLAALTLSSNSLTENSPAGTIIGALSGMTPGSTVAVTVNGGGTVALSGTNLVATSTPADFEAGATLTVTVQETLSGSPNSPRSTSFTINLTDVADGPPLIPLSLSSLTIAENTAPGATVGVLSGMFAGTTVTLVNDAGARFAQSGNNIVTGLTATDFETATSHNITVRQVNAASPNSPLDTTFTINVTDVAESPPPVAIGSLLTSISDGVMSEAAAPGLRNAVGLAMMALNGRLLPTESMNVARSGDSLPDELARAQYATGQTPAVLCRLSAGHNDNLMRTDPASPAGIALMDQWEAVIDWILANASPLTKHIILSTTIGSAVVGEAPYAADVNTLQKAYINSKIASDPRVKLWDAWILYNHTNCTNLSADPLKEHPDNRGGWQLAFGDGVNPGLYDVLDTVVDSATIADIQTWLDANTVNLDADHLLNGGTTGTKTGTVTPSGNWPTGKAINNTIINGTAMALVCSIVPQTGYNRAEVVVSGTSDAAARTVLMSDTANIIITGSTPGQFFGASLRMLLDDGAGGNPKGLMNFALQTGNFGLIGNSIDQSTVITTDIPEAIDWLLVTAPNPVYGSNGPMVANPGLTIRDRASAVQTWKCGIEKPRLFRMFTTPRAAPFPLWKCPGEGANYLQRIVGALTNGTSLRVEPGRWANGGLDNTTFANRRIYMGTAGDTAVGSGTLMVDLTGAGWTWTAAGLVSGQSLWLDIVATTASGSHTERSGPYLIP